MSEKNKTEKVENLPEGWKRVRLGEVIDELGDGGTPSRNNPANFNGGIPWIVIDDIKRSIEKTKETLSLKGLKSSNAKIWPKGSVIVSTGATIGEVGIANIPVATKQGITGIVLDNSKVFNVFFRYYLLYNRNLLIRFSQGTSFSEIRPPTLTKLTISLPPLPEQQKIVEILETVDNVIEKTDAIIGKYKRIKQGLIQDLLTRGIDENGQIRSEKTHKFKDSPLGKIPEEWEVGFITDFAELNPKTEIRSAQIYKFIEMDAIPVMGKHYKYLSFRKGTQAGSRFKNGDILLARITPCAENGKSLLVPSHIDIGIGSTEFMVFRAKKNIFNEFLFYLLISDYVRQTAIALMEGTSGRQRIPNYVFSKIIKVAIPTSKSEQQRIAEILSQIDETIEKEVKYKEKLVRLKRGLMEDLLTGKVRVNSLVKEEDLK